jgi:hypothetical protein
MGGGGGIDCERQHSSPGAVLEPAQCRLKHYSERSDVEQSLAAFVCVCVCVCE